MTNLILPGWGVAVLVSIFVTVLAAAWGIASRASRSADMLDAATVRLVSLEQRIAVIQTIETHVALAQDRIVVIQTELTGLRDFKHKCGSALTALEGKIAHLEDLIARVDRASHPGHRS